MADFLRTVDRRKILHVDLDAFYAQIEMRDHPQLRHKALIISRDPAQSGGRGVVATANYLARRLDVHSAMSAAEAKRLAPDAIFWPADFTKYKAVSQQIHDIFYQFTPKVEPVAFDEAYLDISHYATSGATIAAQIRHEILKTTHLTSSVGVSHNKLLAKLGSNYNKPNGVTVINHSNMLEFIDALPIDKFRGVGQKTKEKLIQLDIHDGRQLRQLSQEMLRAQFGKFGEHLYLQARGMNFSEVKWQRQRQSVGKETTFDRFLHTEAQVQNAFGQLADKMIISLRQQKVVGRTLNIKIRDADFNTLTRSLTHHEPWVLDQQVLVREALNIFDKNLSMPFSIRLLGISMSNLQSSTFEEVSLF